MRNQRNAIAWVILSWFVRRWLKRHTVATVSSIRGGATGGRGRVWGALGAFAVVGMLAGAFIAWRKLGAGEPEEWETAVDVAPAEAPFADPIPA